MALRTDTEKLRQEDLHDLPTMEELLAPPPPLVLIPPARPAARVPAPPPAQDRPAAGETPMTPALDRRASQRVRQLLYADVALAQRGRAAAAACGVVIHDISTAGAGIVHSARLQVGQNYVLTLPRGPKRSPLAIPMTVLRTGDVDGCRFNAPLDPQDVMDAARHGSAGSYPGLSAVIDETPTPTLRRGPFAYASRLRHGRGTKRALMVLLALLTYLKLGT